ncbi:MAG TPA: response regulator [Desulfobulbaceae bacterium]|nr:response regulator [Desulfobulbaceae bacterium]
MKIPGRPEWLTSKIGRRFALYVAFLGVIMALALSIFISYQQYRDRVSFLEDELDTIVTANKSFIEQSLWILDTRSLDLMIQGFLLNGDIVFAQITDDNGKTIVSSGMPDMANKIKKTISLYHQDKGKKIFLGKLTVASSKQSAFRRAQSLILITFFQSAILMFIISVSIMFIFQRLVARHLTTIQRYTRRITFEEPQAVSLSLDRPMNRHTNNDELASTVNAINLMYSNAVKAYRELEDRTAEKIMLERQLRQAQKMESIGRLAGGIAHDFNNVLSIIMGYSDLLLTLISPDDPMREQIQLIHDSGSKAATLTRQLLAFSRKQVLEKKIISINTIVQDFLKILGKMAGEDIIFTTYLAEKSCTVEADPGQIEQIIMNLIVNAKDSMPGGGKIIIETAEVQLDRHYVDKRIEVKPGKYVLLAISDTGEGMDEDVLPKIFDPFFTTKEQGKGTGLGLATVYGIVKQHDGYIYAYSEKEKGTTFKIYFPASNKTTEETENKSTAAALLQGNETILIVDDSPSIRQLIVDILKPLGYKCLQAGSGKDAIDAVREYSGEVHLLLTDVVMPGMSGRDLSTIIVKERPEMKVIFMSGYTENIIVHHGVLEQGITYIAKPITPSALTQKIRSVLYDN